MNVYITQALAPRARLHPIAAYVAAVRSIGVSNAVQRAELPIAHWPAMVRFKDLTQPQYIKRIDPSKLGIVRVVLETTTLPITTGIDHMLPRLPEMEGFHYSGTAFGDLYPVDALSLRNVT